MAKGLLVPLSGTSLEVRGLTFQNAKSPDQNGAGIRLEGRQLIVSGCTFITNENGILATGSDESEVTVVNSRFFGNGYGDGRSHGIYLSNGARLAVESSRFESTRIGHHVKSIASRQTLVRNSRFDDGNGLTSYMVDVTGGGDMIIEDNYVVRRRDAEQETLFNYDTSRRGRKGVITIARNQITNEKGRANLLRNPEEAPVYLDGNSFDNLNGGTMTLPVSTPDLYRSAERSPYPEVPAEGFPEATRPPADLTGLTPVQRRSVEQLIDKGLIPVQADELPVNAEFAAALAAETAAQRSVASRQAPVAASVPSAPAGQTRVVSAPSENPVSVVRRQETRQETPPSRSSRIAEPPIAEPRLPERAGRPAPSPVSAQVRSDILTLPVFLTRQAREELVAVNLVPAGGQRATSGIVTFGQAFRRRLVAPKEYLGLKIGGTVYPVQQDVKALHGDGSVRHAVLTADLRDLETSSSGSLQGILVKRETPPATASLKADARFNLMVSVNGNYADGTPFAGDVDLAPLIEGALSSGRIWLMGSYALETSVSQDIGKFLTVRADIRYLADGSVRTRLVFENHKTFAPGNRDLTYTATVSAGGRTLFRRAGITHYRGANWSEIVWRGRQPGWLIQQDTSQLIAAGAIPQFDLAYGIKEEVITGNVRQLADAEALFSNGLLTKYFPTTGGRQDIGLLPGWDIHWLKTQDSRAFETMTGMAERAGAAPWHFEDEATGTPVRIDQRPNFWATSDGAGREYAPDNIPADYHDGSDGGWVLDNAHKPLLSYTSYLVTGDAYHARELAHEAAYSIARVWPGLRDGKPLVAEAIQVRSRAWALRDIAAAAWLLPDNAPSKGYFRETLELNLEHLLDTYVFGNRMDAAGETEGWFEESVNGDLGRISPWQNDYMVMVLAQEALRGSPLAGEILAWAGNYHKGRFLGAAADPALGAASVHVAKDQSTGEPLGNWAGVFRATKAREEAAETYAAYGAGYVASAYGALAGLYSATGDEDFLRAMKALYEAQESQQLFDPENDGSVYAVPSFLMTARGGNGVEKSVTDLVRAVP